MTEVVGSSGDSVPAAAPATPAATPGDEAASSDGDALPIVGIGASAGGLEALEALVPKLPGSGMAFVIVQHLGAGHESLLADILAHATKLKVVTITNGIAVEPGTIYVAPPGVDVTVDHDRLRVAPVVDQAPRRSIDTFFWSLASEVQTRAIGVILSGAGSDGTAGLRAIKEHGGITFAQDPTTAGQPSMPRSAIEAGTADFTLSPAAIADELVRLAAHHYVARPRATRQFAPAAMTRLLEQVRRKFGVDFSTYKPATIERRIERRMALQRLDDIEAYVRLVDSNPRELDIIYSDLLIGVTSFFRDGAPFETLKTVVFPRLFEHRDSATPIRIWVPGCSTGEEAYSIAICLLEYLGERSATMKIQIFGTDVDDDALTRARHALYPPNITSDVAPEQIQRFFVPVDGGYQVSRRVREIVVFAHHNLGKDPPFSRLDLVSCRNVLIYMQAALQRKILRVFHYALNPDGYLLLGSSESVGDAADQFSLLDRKLKIYQKKNIPSAAVFDFAFGARPLAPAALPLAAGATSARPPQVTMQQLADRKVLDRFGPPGLLLDDKLEIVQFRGDTSAYLSPAPGVATLSVLKLIRPELLAELRHLVQQVMSGGLPASSDLVPRSNGPGAVSMDVLPLPDPGANRTCFLVLFRDATPSPAPVPAASPQSPDGNARVSELERELLVTKEYLQTTVDELALANEELQSSNEELQSSNEELQSSNEELETSKEELQSTNEELETVNEELENRMEQLAVSNDDLQNVIAHVSQPFVIVDMELRIRRFSAAAEKLLNLIAADIGRPVGYLATALNAPQLASIVSETINTVRERAQRVRCSDGHWYTMRAVPYRTQDHTIRGALFELLRASPARKLGELPEIHELVGKVLSTLPHILMMLDEQLRIVWVNKAFFETFVLGAEVMGRALDDVWAGRPNHPELWNALEETAVSGKPFAEVQIAHPFGRKDDSPMKFSARPIAAEGDRPALTLVMMEGQMAGSTTT